MLEEYLNQDIDNPKYLFHGSHLKLNKIIPHMAHDSLGTKTNIDNAIFLFPSFLKVTPYSFKEIIKENSNELKWSFDIPNGDDFPLMRMCNVNADKDVIGYVYVFEKDDDMIKDDDSYQYKCYKELVPIDVVEVHYKDYEKYYKYYRELRHMSINYSNKDSEYIDYVCNELDKKSQEIVDFFDIKDFGKKVSVSLFDSLELFRSECAKVNRTSVSNVPKWVCGMKTPNGDIYTLCLAEYRETKGHENKSIEDLVYLILHEFTHACHSKIKNDNQRGYAWLAEGLATTISHQYDNSKLVFNASLEEMINGTNDYKNYHTMFKYVLDTYSRDYVLELIKNYDLLVRDTPKLYEEVRNLYYREGKKR